MKSKEIFKDVPNYEGMYQVSNLGNVKSLISGKTLKLQKIKNQYVQVGLKNKTFRVHQLVVMAFLNHIPNGHEIIVDHINNDKHDNRLENLQLVSNRKNSSKDRKNGTSKFVGVCWSKRHEKWISKIYIDKKFKYLGLFNSEIEASEKYQKELKKLHLNK